MKNIWIFLARFFGYNQVIEDKTKGYIKFENIAVKEKNKEKELRKKMLEEFRQWRLKEINIKEQMRKDLCDKYGCNPKFCGYMEFESITDKQIIEELKLKVEDLKKDVKKIFDDIIKILDFIKK